MDEEQKTIAWRFFTEIGPAHGYLKGSSWSLCGRQIWMNDQNKIDPKRPKCGSCVRVARVRGLDIE